MRSTRASWLSPGLPPENPKPRRKAARPVDVLATPMSRMPATYSLIGGWPDKVGKLVETDSGTLDLLERVRALREKYDLKNLDEVVGALKVARDTLPGFQFEPRKAPGAPTRWGVMRLYFLWHDVQTIAQQDSKSEREACAAALPAWRDEFKAATTLRRQYMAAKRSPMVAMASRVLAEIGWRKYQDASSGLTSAETRAELLAFEQALARAGMT